MAEATAFTLLPGHIFLSYGMHVIRTVLGSCVAVCLWDSRTGIGAMNHFIYPRVDSSLKSTAQFGDAATLKLIGLMLKEGCEYSSIQAQLFGGAFPEGAQGENVGLANIAIARTILQKKNIRISSEDVGGVMGRKILFDVSSGQVAVLKVQRLRKTDWVESIW